MRRLFLLPLLLLALFAFGCGGAGEEEAEDVPEPPAVPAPEEEREFGTLVEGQLTVGSDIPFPPFEFRDDDGELTGFDVELVNEIASRLGLETEWTPTDFETIFTQLAAGRFDMIASATTITEERQEMINFTRPYYRAQQALIVNTNETPDIQGIGDIGEGHVIAVQRGATGEDWARENLEPQGAQIRSFPQAPDTYTALEAGNVTAVVFDEPSGVEEANRRDALEVLEAIDTGEEYGFGVNPGNEQLLEEVDRVLEEMIADGTYQEIYERWFPDAPAGSVAENGDGGAGDEGDDGEDEGEGTGDY